MFIRTRTTNCINTYVIYASSSITLQLNKLIFGVALRQHQTDQSHAPLTTHGAKKVIADYMYKQLEPNIHL